MKILPVTDRWSSVTCGLAQADGVDFSRRSADRQWLNSGRNSGAGGLTSFKGRGGRVADAAPPVWSRRSDHAREQAAVDALRVERAIGIVAVGEVETFCGWKTCRRRLLPDAGPFGPKTMMYSQRASFGSWRSKTAGRSVQVGLVAGRVFALPITGPSSPTRRRFPPRQLMKHYIYLL
jgi:hypothetical protein